MNRKQKNKLKNKISSKFKIEYSLLKLIKYNKIQMLSNTNSQAHNYKIKTIQFKDFNNLLLYSS